MALKQERDKRAKKNIKNSELKSSKFFGNLQNIADEDKAKKSKKIRVESTAEVNEEAKAKHFKI